MSHHGRQGRVVKPEDDDLYSHRLHVLQHDASVRKKTSTSVFDSTSEPKRARKDLTIVNWKTRLSKGSEIRRRSSGSSQELSHHDPNQKDNAAASPLFPSASTSFLWLKGGQSDPFNAVAISVTSEVNSIISFGRDVFFPTLHDTNGAKQSFTVNNRFQATAMNLSSPGSALGLLSYFATAASIIGGSDWSQKALKYEVECTRKLREKIVHAPISQYPELITQILTLFGCTVLTGRIAEARTHAIILRRLFDTAAERGTVDIAKLCFAMYHDRNLGAMFLVRSSFDVDIWVPELITPIWRTLAKPYAHLSETPSQKLDKSITSMDVPFITLISDIRNHYHTVILTRKRWPQSSTPPDLVTYHITHSLIYESRLINAYVDLTSPPPNSSTKPLLQPSDLHPRATVLLATLYMAHGLLFSGLARLASTSALLKTHLKASITSTTTNATLRTRARDANALLWALFVGATAERVGHGHAKDGDWWFNVRFRDHARSMGLTKWDDVRGRLEGFPCAAEVLEQDVAWVERALRLVYGRDGTVMREGEEWRMYDHETGGFSQQG